MTEDSIQKQQPASNKFALSGPIDDLTFLFPKRAEARNSLRGVYFLLALQGEAFIQIDGKRYSFQPGTFLCLTPNHLLSLLSRTANFRFEYLSFEYDFLSDFPLLLKADISDKMGAIPFLRLHPAEYTLIASYFNFMLDRYPDSLHQMEIIKGLLFSFVIEISRIYSGQTIPIAVSRKNELTDGFFHLLHCYFKEERRASFYAGKLCITDKYLSRVIKEVTGNTFYFWVSDFILKEAKLLLKSTDKSITEISEELQFPNSSFFARFFRQHTGLSPMQFRKES